MAASAPTANITGYVSTAQVCDTYARAAGTAKPR